MQLSPYVLSMPSNSYFSDTNPIPLQQQSQNVLDPTQLIPPQEQGPSQSQIEYSRNGFKGLVRTDSKAEAALQLLALKTSSSSPPASPVEKYDISYPADASFADSGYGHVDGDEINEAHLSRPQKQKQTWPDQKSRVVDHPLHQHLAFSTGSSPLPAAPVKSSLPAFTFAGTPTKKRVSKEYVDENNENEGCFQREERISLDSSPDNEPPVNRPRLMTSSPSTVNFNSSQRSQSRSIRECHPSSSGSTPFSSLTTPHHTSLRHRSIPKGSSSNNYNEELCKLDTYSRPSASLLSSPGNFLLSSPEHAAVSRSLGLVPETGHISSFNFQFLDAYEGGLSEYAAGVFGST